MDWANSRYVRVYVDESNDELRMGWEGWALFVQLLRHSDRAGVLEYAGDQDIPILAARVRIPEDVIERALPRILGTGCVVHKGGYLVIPNKLAAEGATHSDALRARESRARRRELALAGELGLILPDVTNRDANVTNRDANVTNRVSSVTRGHTVSQRVTRCHSDADADADAKTHIADSGRLRLRRQRVNRVKGISATLTDCAAALHCSREQVRRMESGEQEPDPGTLDRWQQWLDMLERKAKAQRTGEESEHKRVQAEFLRLWAEHNGNAPHSWGAKEGAQVNRLLGHYGLEGTLQRARNLFASIGSYRVKTPNLATLGTLVALGNELSQPLPLANQPASGTNGSHPSQRHL